MDEVCIKGVWTGSCLSGRFGLVSKRFGGGVFIVDVFYFDKRLRFGRSSYFGDYFSMKFGGEVRDIDVFYFDKRFGFGKRFGLLNKDFIGGVFVDYFGDYFSESSLTRDHR